MINKITNEKEKRFLEKNINGYDKLEIDELIEKLEDYMQTKTSFNNNDEESMLIENILDKINEL